MRDLRTGALAAASTLALLTGIARADVALPDPTLFAIQYGDFYSYSLPYLAYVNNALNGGGVGPGSPYYVASSPGQISDLIVILTGANGVPVTTNVAGANDAFATPNADATPTFATRDAGGDPPRNGGPNVDGYWGINLATLSTFLNGTSLAFYFNNNQINSGGAINQNLFAKGQIILRDAQGVLPDLYFDFTDAQTPGGVTGYNSPGLMAFSGVPATQALLDADNYILSGGQVCVNTTTLAYRLVPPSCGPGEDTLNHNLGANQAAYALTAPEIDAILATAGFNGYDMMLVDARLGLLNNGYEQLFIDGSSRITIDIAEPATLGVLGVAVMSLGLALRRRRSDRARCA